MTCKILRSDRKTFSLQVTAEGLLVRAPRTATDAQIDGVVARHARWIEKQRRRLAQAERDLPAPEKLTPEALRALKDAARRVIPARAAHFAPLVGVTFGEIAIRSQRTRWGSCSASGSLSFNCLLMLAPPEVLDSVVVHELCHLLEPNHSQRFYAEVLRVFPAYRTCHRWLRDHGQALLGRLPDP